MRDSPLLALDLPAAPRGGLLAGWTRRAFAAWGRGHARKRALAGLDGVFVLGLAEVAAAMARGPLIVASNHVAWWDGVIMVLINARLGGEVRVLMDARGLARLPWFRAFGCVPLHVDEPERARQELAEAARWLDRPGRLLWIYPQGRHVPVDQRPLALKPGVQRLAEASGARVVPLALRYDHIEAPEPAASARFMAPLAPGPSLLDELERAWIQGLEASREAALARAPQGERLVPARRTWSGPTRALGALWRLLVRSGHEG